MTAIAFHLVAACVAPAIEADSAPAGIEHVPSPNSDAGGGTPESVPGSGLDVELYDEVAVHAFDLILSDAAIESLRTDPKTEVEASFVFGEQIFERVGVRLKGSASFQPIDEKPALKIDFDHAVPGQQFYGHEHVGLHNNVWDASAMAETLAYRTWREADAPASRTGYANVSINGELRGLYTIVEPMDGEFVAAWWEGPHGSLYEMTRACDWTSDCTCWELQYEGAAADPEGVVAGCDAVAQGSVQAIADAFDWERLVRYLALERVLNHPDSYSFNLNNYHIYVDPGAEKITMTPWGADSTFVYVYPPWDLVQPCEPTYLDVDTASAYGWLARWCGDEPTCRTALLDEMERLASLLEASDLAGLAAATHERIAPHVATDPKIAYSAADNAYQAACFVDWIGRRPDEVRAWVSDMR